VPRQAHNFRKNGTEWPYFTILQEINSLSQYNLDVPRDYSLEECLNDQLWVDFQSSSPQETPFSSLEFLNLEGNLHKKYVLKTNSEILAALIIPINSENRPKPGSFGSMHQGILFHPRIDSNAGKKAETFQILLNLAIEKKLSFEIALHPTITDLRPVNWVNTDQPMDKMIGIQVRFTGTISLCEFSNSEDYFQSLPKTRRNEIEKNPLIIEQSNDSTIFAEIYKASFAERRIEFSNEEWNVLTSIFDFGTKCAGGKLLLAFHETLSNPIAGIITVEDKDTIYYWFAATRPGYRRMGANSKLLFKSIGNAIGIHKTRLDTCGMNGKEIGFYKASFGATPVVTYGLNYG